MLVKGFWFALVDNYKFDVWDCSYGTFCCYIWCCGLCILDIVDCWLLVAGMAVYRNSRIIFFLIENPENRPTENKTDRPYHSIHRQNRPTYT